MNLSVKCLGLFVDELGRPVDSSVSRQGQGQKGRKGRIRLGRVKESV